MALGSRVVVVEEEQEVEVLVVELG